ncbi:outer membrane beta-barrel protein [Spiribacter sp. 218]|uniref:outer membrane beta-barrel protein n=1 Tax=Spiribacter pallidus TaxID=1987936 RepID=UPI00349FBEEA
MRTRGWITCIGAALLTTAGSLHAQEKIDWYVGAGIGDSTYDTGVNSLSGTASLDEDDRTAKIFAGASFSPNLAIELQYADLGEATLTGNNGDRFNINDSAFVFTSDNARIASEGESIGVSVVGSLPVSDRVNAFGRVGLHAWDVSAEVTTPDQRTELEDDGTDIFFGVGVEIALIEQVGLRIEAEHYELDDDDVRSIGGSLLYRF